MRHTGRSPRKMQYQVFKYVLILSLLILILFSLIIYFYVSRILIDREHIALRDLNNSHLNQIEASLQELDYVTADINYVNRLTGFLTNSSNWSAQDAVRSTVLSIIGSGRKAYQVNLYPLSGEITEMGSLDSSASAGDEDSAWLQSVQELKGKKLLRAPYYTTQGSYSGHRKWLLSVSRAALDSSNNVIGALEAIGRCEQIFSSAISYAHQQENPSALYIFESDGTQVYPYDTTEEEREIGQRVFALTEVNPDTPQEFRGPSSGTRYQYVRTLSGYSGWTYVTVQRRSIIFQPVYRLIALLACVGVILALASVLFAWLFARRMVRPINYLTRLVQRLRLDTLGKVERTNEPVPYEELDRLLREFQTMSESLEASLREVETSRELEFKAQMTALQMQMDPAFYHSTLACIGDLAESGKSADAASMCRTLSDLLHYITDTTTSEVMLFQEIDVIRKYIYCMQMRYQQDLIATLDVDDALNSMLAPRLILQPLVENAIQFSVQSSPPYRLKITGKMEADHWYFRVENSGKTLSPAAINELSNQIGAIDHAGRLDLRSQRFGSASITNVYMRWKLYCHGDEIFRYGNTEEGHSYVLIGRKIGQ